MENNNSNDNSNKIIVKIYTEQELLKMKKQDIIDVCKKSNIKIFKHYTKKNLISKYVDKVISPFECAIKMGFIVKKEQECECGGDFLRCDVCEDPYKCAYCGICENECEKKDRWTG